MVKLAKNQVATSDSEIEIDPIFKHQIDRLHRLTVYGRWLVIAFVWSIVGGFSLWELRYPISLIQEDFTWAAVRYGLYFQPIPAFGLCLCVSVTAGTLVWQARNLIWGLPPHEHRRLVQKICHIRQQGSSHPLWKWVIS